MSLATILIIILLIALFGGFRDWGNGPFYGGGPALGGSLGVVLVILVVLLLLGRL